MGSLSNPKTWAPYMNTKDCSQGFCSLYCPQWCYLIYSPPPPSTTTTTTTTTTFSPLVIAIIGILSSAFLLVSYYAIISKYCRTSHRTRDGWAHTDDVANNHNNHDPVEPEPWSPGPAGLDEALINLIGVHKYKKGDGSVESTDCSVCLGEFQEDEPLRLLPKCSHAFHVACIDRWLKYHSNCPLCRAGIVFLALDPLHQPSRAPNHGPSVHQHQGDLVRGASDLGSSSVIVEIVDNSDATCPTRRSFSMDHWRERRSTVGDESYDVKRSLSSGRFLFGI